MNITEELQKLADLRKNGSLTEQEFAAAKAKLLSAEVSDDSAAVRDSNQVQAKAPVPVLDEQRVWQGRSSHWNYFFSWFFALLLCGFGILCVFLYFSNESPPWLPDREPWLFV